ncbi:MAG: TonB C-terminal domain-containing protein [Burkholderiaceae bacterium]|nr:TonB C-terminal domain-containing protein [Burkholderiaceae bacterium]
MAGLAEDSLDLDVRRRQRLWLAGGVVLALAVVLALGWALQSLLGAPKPAARQVARIAVLPDTPPPPPPPPPKDQPKPEAKPDERPPPPTPANPPPQAPPADAPLKMEGPAGDGPSAFAAGSVTRDYQGGAPTIGASGPAGGSVADRSQDRLYAQASRQALQAEIERLLRSDAEQLQATFSLWVDRQGAIARVALQPSGDGPRDAELNAALDEARRSLRLPPPPPSLAQPMRFRLTLRPQG